MSWDSNSWGSWDWPALWSSCKKCRSGINLKQASASIDAHTYQNISRAPTHPGGAMVWTSCSCQTEGNSLICSAWGWIFPDMQSESAAGGLSSTLRRLGSRGLLTERGALDAPDSSLAVPWVNLFSLVLQVQLTLLQMSTRLHLCLSFSKLANSQLAGSESMVAKIGFSRAMLQDLGPSDLSQVHKYIQSESQSLSVFLAPS